MKAVIRLDVPEWQIGQEVTVFFPDTMCKRGKCEKALEAVAPEIEGSGVSWWHVCGNCHTGINPNAKYCHQCGRSVKWE